MPSARRRRALAFFLPVAVLATLGSGLVYVGVQQDLRGDANDPQRQLAEDAARALDAGAQPAAVVGGSKVDVARSLAPFVVVFDKAGGVLASDGELDGHDPAPPRGVLDAAGRDRPNVVTWQPRPGVRVATVTVPWQAGTVLAGRSLREVERRENEALLFVAAAWLAMMVALGVAALVAAWLWPSALAADPPVTR
jgi:hypothetical protein